MKRITITKPGATRVRRGHLWIYRSDIVDRGGAEGGQVVEVRDQHGNFVGQALFSDASQISLRLLAQSSEPIDREWWRRRILEAAERRAAIARTTDGYRLVYSEGDLLPSLIIDTYAGVLSLQTLSQGTEAIKSMLVDLLVEEFKPRAVVERNDVRVRQLEGLQMLAGTLYGQTPDELEITQNGIRFLVAPLSGQKTGAFLDQRENRNAAREHAHGKALDCFTFNGAFALHLAGVCENVIAIDISAEALSGARRNAELNGITNIDFREANVFDALHELETARDASIASFWILRLLRKIATASNLQHAGTRKLTSARLGY